MSNDKRDNTQTRVPKKYRKDAVISAYAVIVVTAGASLTFNIYHAAAPGGLKIALAYIFGIVPPFAATMLSHVAATINSTKWMKALVFLIVAAAMFVSAFATAEVVKPIDGLSVGVVFSVMADAASMVCLKVILDAGAARQAKIAVPGTGQDRGTGYRKAVPGPASTPVPERVPAEAVPGYPVPAAVPVPGTAETPARYLELEDRPAPQQSSARPPAVDPEPGDAMSFRSEEDLEGEALKVVADYKATTGKRMNTKELASALGVRYKRALIIRSEIQAREEAAQ